MSKFIELEAFGKTERIHFSKSEYASNGSLAIECMYEDEEFGGALMPWGSLTVNLRDDNGKNFAFVNSNGPTIPDIARTLELMELIVSTGIWQTSGFCTYELYEFTDEFLNEWCE